MRGGEQLTEQSEAEQPETRPELANALRPQIYVASLADFEAGHDHGRWLDAASKPEEMRRGIQSMLGQSQLPVAKKWAIHGVRDFGCLTLDEHEDLERVHHLAKQLLRYGPAYAAWKQIHADQPDAEPDNFYDRYLGFWPSVGAYAERFLDDLGVPEVVARRLPKWLAEYVQLDYERYGQNMAQRGEIRAAADADGVHIFDGKG